MHSIDFPNTVFLPERAEWALNCLTGILDRDKSHLPYCLVDISGEAPSMIHTRFDWSDHTSRILDAIILAQEMSGSEKGSTEVARLIELLRSGFGEDGLHYTPENPWTPKNANMHYQRSVLDALLTWYLRDKSEEAKERMVKLVRGLAEISVKRDDYWFFPAVEYLPGGWPRTDWDIFGTAADPANTSGRLLFRLCRVYEELKLSEAADLAGMYARHAMRHSSAYLEDGRFADGMEFREGHFHSRAVTLLGVIRYGYTFEGPEALEWGRKVFDRACLYGTEFGWFPERIVESGAHGCETCAIVDMMESAIWLAKAGHEAYWDVAERFLRNQLLESQLISTEGVEETVTRISDKTDSEWETHSNVLARSIGGFAGWSQPNDLISKVMHEWDLYACCCSQGVRGLFNAWNHVVTRDGTQVSVNFLMNYGNEDLTVKSRLPHEGSVVVEPNRPLDLRVRVPGFVRKETVVITMDGERLPFTYDGVYAVLGSVKPGTTAEIRFEMAETTTEEHVLGVTYRVEWRGNTVVGIDPPGKTIPLYRRSHLKEASIDSTLRNVPKVMFKL